VRTAAQHLAFANAGDRARGEPVDAAERGDRGRAADPVGGEPEVALELHDGGRGFTAENAVFAPGVEAEGVEAALKLRDIVAPEHRLTEIHHAIAEGEAALHERGPRLRTAEAVDEKTTLLLEVPHGGLGRRPEVARLVGRAVVAQRGETALQVPDTFAYLPPLQRRRHLRWSP
jgi:hypothetical protein